MKENVSGCFFLNTVYIRRTSQDPAFSRATCIIQLTK